MNRRPVESLPYLVRFLKDDVEVLLDREYAAMWWRRPGEKAKKMYGEKSLPCILRSEYFFIGAVGKSLAKLLIKIEEEFISGRSVQELMDMMDKGFPRMRSDMRREAAERNRSRFVVLTPTFPE
jgi:hypothetical protein